MNFLICSKCLASRLIRMQDSPSSVRERFKVRFLGRRENNFEGDRSKKESVCGPKFWLLHLKTWYEFVEGGEGFLMFQGCTQGVVSHFYDMTRNAWIRDTLNHWFSLLRVLGNMMMPHWVVSIPKEADKIAGNSRYFEKVESHRMFRTTDLC